MGGEWQVASGRWRVNFGSTGMDGGKLERNLVVNNHYLEQVIGVFMHRSPLATYHFRTPFNREVDR
jgi:hypothetical protein